MLDEMGLDQRILKPMLNFIAHLFRRFFFLRLQERWAPGCSLSLLNSGALHSLACRRSVPLILDMSSICWMHQNRLKFHLYTMGATVRNIARIISPMLVMHFVKVAASTGSVATFVAISAPMTLSHATETHSSSESDRCCCQRRGKSIRFGDNHCAFFDLLLVMRKR